MAAKLETTAFIDRYGKLQINNREKFAQAIAANPNVAGTLTFEPYSNRISHNQRKYFFGVIVDLLHTFFVASGNEDVTKADVYTFIKNRFLFREQICKITGQYVKVLISLSDNEAAMNRAEFTEKKEAIQMWAAQTLNLDIPDPDKHWKMYKHEKDKPTKELQQ